MIKEDPEGTGDGHSPRAWSFLTIDGDREYGGNAGHEDDPTSLYRYDSDVANHLQVRAGDVAVIRSRDTVLGIATIESVVEGERLKDRFRCPTCAITNVKERRTAVPRWRCHNGHLFDEPVRLSVKVDSYEAHYAKTFRNAPPGMTVRGLLSAVLRPSDQMSIKEIDLGRLDAELRDHPGIAALLNDYARRMRPIDVEGDGQKPASIIEERRRVLREIAIRRGQGRFRRRLIARYGLRCQVSGCAFPGLVEAAHVRPYAKSADNSATNGLLLRSDLHTLFDLGLLGIEPATLVARLRPEVLAAGYEALDGKPLEVNGTIGPDRGALEERWDFFAGGSATF